MKVALVLHIYQPPVQEESIVRQIASECYLPLVKIIKSRRNHKFTLNIPLSLLELMDRFGYKDWISDIRCLYESDRIELTGTGAYHPLLTKIPRELVEEQISLNEYGLGYYLGSRQGFEGEPSIMIKNIQGFFPPELAVNNKLVDTLSDFGYRWFLAEKTALPKDSGSDDSIFGIKGKAISVVFRDRDLSNLISFKRDLVMDDVSTYLRSKIEGNHPLVVALDGEYFGHHYKDGIEILENFLDELEKLGIGLSSVSEIAEEFEHHEIEGIVESGWGASDEEFAEGQVYPFWVNKKNKIQVKLWELQELITDKYLEKPININNSEFHTIAIWKESEVKNIQDTEEQSSILKYILIHKYLHSDKFWWSSKKEILGKLLYHPGLVKGSLELAKTFSLYYPNDDTATEINSKITEVEELLI